MAQNQYGKGHIFGLSGATLSCSAITSFVSPNMQGASVDHGTPDPKLIRSQANTTTGIVVTEDDSITVMFELIPEGTTLANAKKAAAIPSIGSSYGSSGFPVVEAGGFADMLNTGGLSTQPWFYLGGASWGASVDDVWTLKLPLKRFLNITSATAIT